jgi:hypothetical protein
LAGLGDRAERVDVIVALVGVRDNGGWLEAVEEEAVVAAVVFVCAAAGLSQQVARGAVLSPVQLLLFISAVLQGIQGLGGEDGPEGAKGAVGAAEAERGRVCEGVDLAVGALVVFRGKRAVGGRKEVGRVALKGAEAVLDGHGHADGAGSDCEETDEEVEDGGVFEKVEVHADGQAVPHEGRAWLVLVAEEAAGTLLAAGLEAVILPQLMGLLIHLSRVERPYHCIFEFLELLYIKGVLYPCASEIVEGQL